VGPETSARALAIALALTTVFLLAEVAGGVIFNSLALLSDAAHMFTDAAALAIALAAIAIGRRPADDRRTFGYRRFEILAAALNAVLLCAVAAYVLVEGIRRIVEPEPLQSLGMLAVGFVGLIVNLVSMRVLAAGKQKSLNVRGAYLEVWSDMLASVGVVAGAALIWATGWRWIDPVVAIAIGIWVLPRTWLLLRDTTNILLEGAPREVALPEIRSAIASLPGVAGLHDLHVWISGADQPSCTVHVELTAAADAETVRVAVAARLAHFGLRHVTVQTEREACEEHAAVHR
jgi:cobalt-zinc-cadmium efflux system protein